MDTRQEDLCFELVLASIIHVSILIPPWLHHHHDLNLSMDTVASVSQSAGCIQPRIVVAQHIFFTGCDLQESP